MAVARKIYVAGTFDCFHAGHVRLLRGARGLADRVIVAINGDEMTASAGKRPVMNELERLAVVAACRYVDHAFITETFASQRPAIELLDPDYLLHGDDCMGDSFLAKLGVDGAFLVEHGIQVKYVPHTAGISSKEIRMRVLRASRDEEEEIAPSVLTKVS